MSEDDQSKSRKPITPPQRDKRVGGRRALVEAAAQATPITAGLARLYQTTHPPRSEEKREIWESEISDRSNEHDTRLDQHERHLTPKTETIEGTAAALVEALARDCADGLRRKRYTVEELGALLPGIGESDLENPAFDLSSLGLLDIKNHTGGLYIRIWNNFYCQFDHQVMGWNTRIDAAELARNIVVSREFEHTPSLHEHLGWGRRRFNPALAYLMEFIPAGRTRQVKEPNYCTLGFALVPEDRANLRRFVREVEAEQVGIDTIAPP